MGNSRFSDGFLIGALIGGAAVFLLGTKKGNKVLKAISEEGLSGLNNIMDDFEAKLEGSAPMPSKTVDQEIADNVVIEEVIESKPRSKRFFKKK